VINKEHNLRTNLKYIKYIISGLKKHDINKDYIQKVKSLAIQNNPNIKQEILNL